MLHQRTLGRQVGDSKMQCLGQEVLLLIVVQRGLVLWALQMSRFLIVTFEVVMLAFSLALNRRVGGFVCWVCRRDWLRRWTGAT